MTTCPLCLREFVGCWGEICYDCEEVIDEGTIVSDGGLQHE